jgi:hypothetical protein
MRNFQFLSLLSTVNKFSQVGPIFVYDEKKTYPLVDVERFALGLIQHTINIRACKFTDHMFTDLNDLPLIRNPFPSLMEELNEPLFVFSASTIYVKYKTSNVLQNPTLKSIKASMKRKSDYYKETLPFPFFRRDNVLSAMSKVEYILELAANNPEKFSTKTCEEMIEKVLSKLAISKFDVEPKSIATTYADSAPEDVKKEKRRKAKRVEDEFSFSFGEDDTPVKAKKKKMKKKVVTEDAPAVGTATTSVKEIPDSKVTESHSETI